MNKPFKFLEIDNGQDTQRIAFTEEGETTKYHPIPGVVLPEDTAEKFWVMYQLLVDAGFIENKTPTFTG